MERKIIKKNIGKVTFFGYEDDNCLYAGVPSYGGQTLEKEYNSIKYKFKAYYFQKDCIWHCIDHHYKGEIEYIAEVIDYEKGTKQIHIPQYVEHLGVKWECELGSDVFKNDLTIESAIFECRYWVTHRGNIFRGCHNVKKIEVKNIKSRTFWPCHVLGTAFDYTPNKITASKYAMIPDDYLCNKDTTWEKNKSTLRSVTTETDTYTGFFFQYCSHINTLSVPSRYFLFDDDFYQKIHVTKYKDGKEIRSEWKIEPSNIKILLIREDPNPDWDFKNLKKFISPSANEPFASAFKDVTLYINKKHLRAIDDKIGVHHFKEVKFHEDLPEELKFLLGDSKQTKISFTDTPQSITIELIDAKDQSHSSCVEQTATFISAKKETNNTVDVVIETASSIQSQNNADSAIVEYTEPADIDYVIIKTSEKNIATNGNLYEATRRAWKASLDRAKTYKYVLSVINGKVMDVYEADKWQEAAGEDGRIEFVGHIAPENISSLFKGKMIPGKYRVKGLASPFLYKR